MPERLPCSFHNDMQRMTQDACSLSKVVKDRLDKWEADYEEVFHGENSLKSRLVRAEEDVKTLKTELVGGFSLFKWIIAGLVVIFMAFAGGSFLYLAGHIDTLYANQITYMEHLGLHHK